MPLIRPTQSLIFRITVFAIAFVLIGTAIRYFVLVGFIRANLTSVVSAQLVALSRDMALSVDYKIVEREKMLRQLAGTLPRDLLHEPQRLRAWLGERHELHPVFSLGLFVIATDGTTIADYPRRDERLTVNYADRDYFQGALAGRFTLGRPVVGRVTREPVLPMGMPITDAAGRVQAVLAGITGLNAPGFLDGIHRGRIGETGGYLLISPKDEIIVAATKTELILKPTARPGVNPLHDQAMAGFRGPGITVNAQGEEEVVGIASVDSTGWFVVARLPSAEAFSVVESAKFFVLRFTPVAIVTIVLVLYFALRHYLRPLARAADQANRIANGELPLQPLPVRRTDEVGFLVGAFNRLLEKLAATQADLSRMVRRDPLTNLPNRLELSERLRLIQARAHREKNRFAILFLDLDGFKPINDQLGHDAGDEALVEIARRLSAVVREVDTLARVGGDEFVIALGDLDRDPSAARAAAHHVAEKCIGAVGEPMTLKGTTRQLGVSIGIAISDGNSIDAMMSAADDAMYAAKKSGGCCARLG